MSEIEQIVNKVLSRLPLADTLWTGEQVASYLQVSVRQAKERICLAPDFPAPIRLPGGGKAHVSKRWHPSEVMEWAERHRDRR